MLMMMIIVLGLDHKKEYQIGLSVRKGNKGNKIGMIEVKERVMRIMMRGRVMKIMMKERLLLMKMKGVTVALISRSLSMMMMMVVMMMMTIPKWVGVIYFCH